MQRVIHFELAAREPQRAAQFYQKAFGWEINQWGGPNEYWLVTTGPDGQPGINGGILRHRDGMPGTINTVGVASVDRAVEQIARCGGQIVEPRIVIPGVGYQAYCKDTEDVMFGIHQFDRSAK